METISTSADLIQGGCRHTSTSSQHVRLIQTEGRHKRYAQKVRLMRKEQ